MIMAGREYKQRSRSALAGRYPLAVSVFLLSELIVAVLGLIFISTGEDLFSIVAAALSSLIIGLISCVLDTGVALVHLKIARNQDARIQDISFGFRHHPDKILTAALILLGINLLAAVPFAAYSARIMTGEGVNALRFFLLLLSGSIVILPARLYTRLAVCWVLWLIVAAAVNLNYALLFYLFLDEPELTALQLLRRSRELMRGYRLRLLWLGLSFAGMILLGLLSLGIGFLWISPYLHTALTFFYLDVRERQKLDASVASVDGSPTPLQES